MYKEKDFNHAANVLKFLAAAHEMPEEEIRAELIAALQAGRTNSDPAVQKRWAAAPSGLEAILLWLGEQVKNAQES